MSDVPNPNVGDPQADAQTRMQGLVDFLNSYIAYYCSGGWVRMLDFDGQTLRVEMGGACVECPYADSTLHGWFESTARQFFPALTGVEAVFAAE